MERSPSLHKEGVRGRFLGVSASSPTSLKPPLVQGGTLGSSEVCDEQFHCRRELSRQYTPRHRNRSIRISW